MSSWINLIGMIIMPNRNEELIYKILSHEPVTPNEIATKLKISHKTAQRALMQLALTKKM